MRRSVFVDFLLSYLHLTAQLMVLVTVVVYLLGSACFSNYRGLSCISDAVSFGLCSLGNH